MLLGGRCTAFHAGFPAGVPTGHRSSNTSSIVPPRIHIDAINVQTFTAVASRPPVPSLRDPSRSCSQSADGPLTNERTDARDVQPLDQSTVRARWRFRYHHARDTPSASHGRAASLVMVSKRLLCCTREPRAACVSMNACRCGRASQRRRAAMTHARMPAASTSPKVRRSGMPNQ